MVEPTQELMFENLKMLRDDMSLLIRMGNFLADEMRNHRVQLFEIQRRLIEVEKGQGVIDERLVAVEERLVAVEERLVAVDERQIAMEERLVAIDGRQVAMDERLVRIERRMGFETERV